MAHDKDKRQLELCLNRPIVISGHNSLRDVQEHPIGGRVLVLADARTKKAHERDARIFSNISSLVDHLYK